jgi:DNA-binding XRE family transcriptional regulator
MQSNKKNKIREFRESQGIKQNFLAEKIGVPPCTLSIYERENKVDGKYSIFVKIAKFFGLKSTDDLFESD